MATRVIPPPKPFQVVPLEKHTATVIFMHGLGDTGAGWLPVAEKMKTELPHVKWLLPNAPQRPITINGGFVMPGWFDLHDLEGKVEDRDAMLESARTIDKHIQDEIDGGIPSDRIVVGGFSQGGCISLLAGLTNRGHGDWKLGGVVVLSSWMPLRNEFVNMASSHLKEMPVLVCHGTADPLVQYHLAQKTSEFLTKKLGLPDLMHSSGEDTLGMAGLSFRSYESLEHTSCDQEIKDVLQFLKRVLPRN